MCGRLALFTVVEVEWIMGMGIQDDICWADHQGIRPLLDNGTDHLPRDKIICIMILSYYDIHGIGRCLANHLQGGMKANSALTVIFKYLASFLVSGVVERGDNSGVHVQG